MNLREKLVPLLGAGALVALTAMGPPVHAQETGTITGVVTDASSGQTLESAQISIPALERGSLSNQEGRFLIIDVPAGEHQVQADLIGYTSETRTVTVSSGQTATLDIQMESRALQLQELVVTGVAGETPRVKLPFTVESADFSEVAVPAMSAEGLLQAKMPGVRVTRGDAQPGGESAIMLRGPTSITGGQQPLIIIDGVITNQTLADIESLDVESIEVVKGAAAASMYGSRAQAGVIQIQTKRGSGLATDETRITVRNEYGNQSLEGEIGLASNHQYAMTDDQSSFVDGDGNPIDWGPGVVLAGGDPNTTFQDNPFPGEIHDHLDDFFNPGDFYSNYVALEGRTGSTNYRASFTNHQEDGILVGHEGFNRRNVRLNLDHQVWDNLSVQFNQYYSQSTQDELGTNPFFNLTLTHRGADLLERDPETGELNPTPDPLSLELNPLYVVEMRDDTDQRQRYMGSANVRFSPTSWFNIDGNFSLDRFDLNRQWLEPKGMVTEADADPSEGTLFRRNTFQNDINGSVTAAVNRAFGDFTTRTRVRYLMEDRHFETFFVDGNDLVVAETPVLESVYGEKGVGSTIEDVTSEGYFFISSLDYAGKYVGDVMVRRDGSSLFGPEQRWQTYYRASGAWRMAQEDWWPVEALTEFKPRASLGTAGGRPEFDAQYETYAVDVGRVEPVTLGNRNLRPEFATEQEYGLDLVFQDRVAAGLTYVMTEVEDQLLEVPLSAFRGFQTQWQNAGTLEGNTVEAYVESSIIEQPDMGWTMRINFDRNRQTITQLDIPPYRTGPGDEFYIREGEALGTFYGLRHARSCADVQEFQDINCAAFDVNDDGWLVYVGEGNTWQDGMEKDLWGTTSPDGEYDWGMPVTVEDETGQSFFPLGNTTPDYNLSVSSTFRWNNVSLYTLFDAEQGASIYNQTRQWAYREHRHGATDQAGKPDARKKPTGYYSALYSTNTRNNAFVEDGSFVKLRELSLRYTMPADQMPGAMSRVGLTQASINLIGRNLLTFTDFTGYDPEVGTPQGTGSAVIGRVDTYQYPNFRTLSASVELVF